MKKHDPEDEVLSWVWLTDSLLFKLRITVLILDFSVDRKGWDDLSNLPSDENVHRQVQGITPDKAKIAYIIRKFEDEFSVNPMNKNLQSQVGTNQFGWFQ